MLHGDLEKLLNQKHAWLLGRARRLCKTRMDAEDLVQEALSRFLATFGDASRLPHEEVCAKWLASTMTRCFLSQLRHQRTRERSMTDPGLCREWEETAEPTPSDHVTRAQLDQAIRTLSPQLREPVTMKIRGWKYRAIARELGITVGAVGLRLFRARAMLRGTIDLASTG